MTYCTFLLQCSTYTKEALLYSTPKRPLLLQSQESRTPIKLHQFTYTEDKQKVIVNDMTQISVPNQCEYAFQYDESTHQQCEPITILELLNTCNEWEMATVQGKVLSVQDKPRTVGSSPRKRYQLLEAVIGDASATIPIDIWESLINKVQKGKF